MDSLPVSSVIITTFIRISLLRPPILSKKYLVSLLGFLEREREREREREKERETERERERETDASTRGRERPTHLPGVLPNGSSARAAPPRRTRATDAPTWGPPQQQHRPPRPRRPAPKDASDQRTYRGSSPTAVPSHHRSAGDAPPQKFDCACANGFAYGFGMDTALLCANRGSENWCGFCVDSVWRNWTTKYRQTRGDIPHYFFIKFSHQFSFQVSQPVFTVFTSVFKPVFIQVFKPVFTSVFTSVFTYRFHICFHISFHNHCSHQF